MWCAVIFAGNANDNKINEKKPKTERIYFLWMILCIMIQYIVYAGKMEEKFHWIWFDFWKLPSIGIAIYILNVNNLLLIW